MAAGLAILHAKRVRPEMMMEPNLSGRFLALSAWTDVEAMESPLRMGRIAMSVELFPALRQTRVQGNNGHVIGQKRPFSAAALLISHGTPLNCRHCARACLVRHGRCQQVSRLQPGCRASRRHPTDHTRSHSCQSANAFEGFPENCGMNAVSQRLSARHHLQIEGGARR